jgi:peptidoglycan-associated lipoprotein
MRTASRLTLVLMVLATLAALGCRRNAPPVARPTAPPPPPTSTSTTRPAPPTPVNEPTFVPPEPVPDERITSSTSLDQLNKNSPLKPVYFEYDSSELSPASQAVLDENAAILRKNGSWMVTIEGHCDERGTAEYNLALGERRAVTARTYLLSLGIPATRLRTVSYGKEFPFDPGRDERAFSQNRRAHFVITAQ